MRISSVYCALPLLLMSSSSTFFFCVFAFLVSPPPQLLRISFFFHSWLYHETAGWCCLFSLIFFHLILLDFFSCFLFTYFLASHCALYFSYHFYVEKKLYFFCGRFFFGTFRVRSTGIASDSHRLLLPPLFMFMRLSYFTLFWYRNVHSLFIASCVFFFLACLFVCPRIIYCCAPIFVLIVGIPNGSEWNKRCYWSYR